MPIITAGTPSGEQPIVGTGNPVTEDALDKRIKGLTDTIEGFIRPMSVVIVGIIVVLFVGLLATLAAMIAMAFEAYHWKYDSNTALTNEVNEQNTKLEIMEIGLRKYHIIP